jgi:hypothetical protein
MGTGSGRDADSDLTTPHKLQAEARSRKRAGRRLGVYPIENRRPQACQLHAVVRQPLLIADGPKANQPRGDAWGNEEIIRDGRDGFGRVPGTFVLGGHVP